MFFHLCFCVFGNGFEIPKPGFVIPGLLLLRPRAISRVRTDKTGIFRIIKVRLICAAKLMQKYYV